MRKASVDVQDTYVLCAVWTHNSRVSGVPDDDWEEVIGLTRAGKIRLLLHRAL